MNPEPFNLLLLIIIANGAPILARKLLNSRFKLAVDFGQKLPDKNHLFGTSKTWRGILASLLATTIAAWLLGQPPETGTLIAFYAMSGDLFASFIKRRLSMKPGSMAPLLDQVPESLLPAYLLKDEFDLDGSAIMELILIFIIIELILSHILKGTSINCLCPLRDLKHVAARRETQQNGYSILQVHNAADACFRSRPTGLHTRLRLSVALS